MAKSTQRAPRAARSSKPVSAVADVAESEAPAKDTVRVYPTHRRQAGPLVVALPSVDGHSDELVIDDEGADLEKAFANQLIAFREVTTEAPAAAEE